MTVITRYRETLEFAAELGDRFPDYTDQQVLDAVDEFDNNRPGYTNPHSAFAQALIRAYITQDANNANDWFAKAFGIRLF